MWKGGKYSGGIKITSNNTYCARIMKDRKSYCKTFKSKLDAQEWLRIKSEEFGFIKNQYRLIDNEYLEVKLQGDYILKCDIDDFLLIIRHTWCAKPDKNNLYCYTSIKGNKNKKNIFHRKIRPWGENEEWKQVDHINLNGLDNRRSNLRDGSGNLNNLNQRTRKDNKSGKTGVHYSNYDKSWTVQWQENGKRKTKSFSVSDTPLEQRNKYNHCKLFRTYEEAKKLAENFRKQKDKQLGYTNGY